MGHRDVATVGLGGPVGSGKTALVQYLAPRLDEAGYNVGVIANDIMTKRTRIASASLSTDFYRRTSSRELRRAPVRTLVSARTPR